MPNSAIQTGAVDYILAPSEMGTKLEEIVFSRLPKSPELTEIEKIFEILNLKFGISFQNYKEKTLLRQLEKAVHFYKLHSIQEYLEFLQANPEELKNLYQSFLIGVTSFFRDEKAFQSLAKHLEERLQNFDSKQGFRVWVIGCSTGEEAYTLAILLTEVFEKLKIQNLNFQIFATDIYEESINFARRGIYTEEQVKNVPLEYKNKYFTKVELGWEVDKTLRNKILFSNHNILFSPPFLRIDLISCRNLLIYFKPEVQNNLFPIFHYSLHDNGILFLGKSESVLQLEELFEIIDARHKIFRKRKFATPKPLKMGIFSPKPLRNLPLRPQIDQSLNFRLKIFEIYTELINHPFVILNSHLDILETKGDLRDFLQIPQGILNLNISKLLRKDLLLEVKSLILKCIKTHKIERTKFKKFSLDSKNFFLKVTVSPLEKELKKDFEDLFILIFERIPFAEELKQETVSTNELSVSPTTEELQKALEATKEQLQTYIEELETSNEELQATNEELQTSNEELQSSNEELQTAYAEIKHINEELRKTDEELLELNQIFSLFFESVNQSNLLLEENLNIKIINQNAIKLFETVFSKRPQTGQNLIEILPENLISKVIQLIKASKESQKQIKETIPISISNKSQFWELIITPLKLGFNKKYIGISIIDITDLKTKEIQIYKRDEILASFLGSKNIYLIRTDLQGNYTFVNKAFCEKFGYAPEQLLGKPYIPTVHPEDVGKCNQVVLQLLESPDNLIQVELRKPNPKGGFFETEWEFSTILDEEGKIQEIQAVGKDITLLKQQKQDLENQKRQLELILWSGSLGTWDWDVVNDRIQFNEKWGEILGFSKDELVMNFEQWSELIHPADRDIVLGILQKVISGELSHYEIEHRKRTKSGTYKWINLSGKAWERDATGKATRILGIHQDTTRRVETEFKEKILEERNQAILSSMNAGMLIYDMMGMITYINKEAEKILEISSSELIAHSITHATQEELLTLKELETHIWETIQTKRTEKNVMLEILTPKKQRKWISLSTQFLTHPFTELPYSVFAIFHDVTNLKTVEQNLEEKQWLLSEIGKLSHIGAWEYNPLTQEMFLTEEVYKLFEVSEGEKTKTIHLDNFLNYFLKEDRLILHSTFLETVQTGKSFDLELKLKTATGEEIWVRVTGKPIINKQEHLTKVIGSIQRIVNKTEFEITILERQKRIAALLDFLPFALYTVDAEGFLNYINYEAQKLIEFDVKAQFQKWNIINGLLDTEEKVVSLEKTPLARAFTEKILIQGEEYIIQRNYKKIYVLIYAIPFLDNTQEVVGGMSIIIDITKIKELEKSLKFKNQKLESLNKELEQFNYLTSHEMQEPLGNILASIDIIFKHYRHLIAQPIQKYLDFIQQSTTRMKEQIRALLEYSLIGSKPELSKVNLNYLIAQILEEIKEEIEKSQCKLEISQLPEIICLPVEIKVLFKHLILNAIKFRSKTANPKIQITSEGTSDYYVFHVDDNGIGVQEEYRQKIFQMFQRLHNRNEYEGIGTGLAFCEK
ncbi:MAG: PAS domain S-box protein, partial [Leptospiraceae bacterium]|nr:PAS domain S-box protein [Leptospiraceae bacterium]